MRQQVAVGIGCALLLGVFGGAREAQAFEHTHDGFYLQMAIGPGYLQSTAELGPSEQKLSGMSVSSQLLIGGSLMPGFVLGGGLISDYAFSPGFKVNGQEAPFDDLTMSLFAIGAFLDFYPNPTKGLHFQGLVGWGALQVASGGDVGGSDPTGLAIALGVGHEWWVSGEWGIGVLGRLAYAPLSLDGVSYTTISPAVLVTFTYN